LADSRHFVIQSEVKQKPIMTRWHTLSRASHQQLVYALSLDWFTGLSVFFVFGHSDHFCFGFTTLS